MTKSDGLVKRLRDRGVCSLAHNSCRNDIAWEQAADRIEELGAKLAESVEALSVLVLHTRDCERELTEELHHAEFCGESLPLTKARATLAELKGETDE